MAEVIAQLHNAPHPKLVIAYIDIGQAEEFRTYWQPGWGIGNPEWIVALDPDGWEGNFPVAYWHDEWHEIWLGEGGYLQAILEAGFDGVYLDWVEAYSDENVIAVAERDGADPRQEMIWWIGDIADFARAQRPDFIVIGQNAAELATSDKYVDIIDAIAQEQVWFDGAADNDPPGDCPLPRTEAEVETEAYVASLSEPCRAMYEEFPDSTLHVSSEGYLQDLTLAQSKGVIIFTVDYALEPENVAWVYETSRGLGFVPFGGNRALDRYVAPVPETNDTAIGSDWWQPAVNTTWQWQLDQPIDQSFDVDMYDIDLFESDASVVDALHAQGREVVCYISVGSWEDWRPDQDQFPASVIGKDYGGWPGEKWLDIRQIDLLAPIMRARLDECQAKGFDGIEPDNIDSYPDDTGFPLTYQDQLNYNIWLANEAHARGLSIGLKNDPEQVADLLPHFDWALTEDCFAEGWCEEMLPFIEAGKPVFAAEYTDTGMTTDQFCPQAREMNFSAILKNRDLDAYREACH
jgi:endo-alpha-1,4-polygalactosaminidase (GH114 family)